MALTPDALEHRETPVVNSSFVVVNVALGTAQNLLTTVNTNVTAVGTEISHTYPSMPLGLLISANTAAVLLFTANSDGTPTNVATGINIPIGQSLYLPLSKVSAAVLNYTCSAAFSVACFYAD